MFDYAYKSSVPEGSWGDWRVERFAVSQADADRFNLRCAIAGSGYLGVGRDIKPGIYTKLTRNGSIIMSDTPAEVRDHYWFAKDKEGHILIAGLGLGIAVELVAGNSEVGHVTIVEISSDVIALVWPFINTHGKCDIVNADIFEWKAPKRIVYDYAWFDIWDNICSENYEDMKRLKRKFARKAKQKECWSYIETLRHRRYWR